MQHSKQSRNVEYSCEEESKENFPSPEVIILPLLVFPLKLIGILALEIPRVNKVKSPMWYISLTERGYVNIADE